MKPWYQQASSLGDAFDRFHREISQGTALDEKTIELIKIAVSSVLRCSHCTQGHIKKAKSIGVTSKEITDALLVSSLQAAGTQLFWDKENFESNLLSDQGELGLGDDSETRKRSSTDDRAQLLQVIRSNDVFSKHQDASHLSSRESHYNLTPRSLAVTVRGSYMGIPI